MPFKYLVMKDRNKPYTVGWCVIDRGRAYNSSTKYCKICKKEKYHIKFNQSTAT